MIRNILLCLLFCCICACSSSHKKVATNTAVEKPAAPLSPITQAVDFIEKNNLPAAKIILENYVATRPLDWAHRMPENDQVKVYFWDKEQLAECGIFEIVAAGGKKMEPVLDASYSKAYYLLAFIALESRFNPFANALSNLDKGLQLEPDQPTLLYEKASLFYKLKRHQEAIQEYQRLIETSACLPNPQRARAYRGLGQVLIAQAKYDDAEVAFYQSLKFEPDNKKAIDELNYIDKARYISFKK